MQFNPAALGPVVEALKEALEYQNDDTECLMAEEIKACWDQRCHGNVCMVARVNRWRAALALAMEPSPLTSQGSIDGRDSGHPCCLDGDAGDARSPRFEP